MHAGEGQGPATQQRAPTPRGIEAERLRSVGKHPSPVFVEPERAGDRQDRRPTEHGLVVGLLLSSAEAAGRAVTTLEARPNDPVVEQSGLIFESHRGGRQTVKRLDLRTGQVRTLVRASPKEAITELHGGGGWIGLMVEAARRPIGLRSRVYAMRATGGPVLSVVSSIAFERGDSCRGAVLRDVSPEGEFVVAELRDACGPSGRLVSVLKAYRGRVSRVLLGPVKGLTSPRGR